MRDKAALACRALYRACLSTIASQNIGPTDREQHAAIIGEWLKTEARYLA